MDKEQFDEFLGGTVQLPHDVQMVKLAAARASEIAAMTYSIENPQQSKLVFQKLPIHMRRRVMSHNAKRMPRRLREAHLRQMTKSGLPPKCKRPSRKYRRRPQNLLQEYNRRKRRFKWLETHIWHAKRFKMIEKWGYKIGESPNDKSFRACYRAAAKHCLMRDISYYNCMEIRGPKNVLVENLKEHCNPGELTFGAKIYLRGDRAGNLIFYKKNSYPYAPIGNVDFLWNPEEGEEKTIWIWIHPLFYQNFFKEIVESFKFNATNKSEEKKIGEKCPEIYDNAEKCCMIDLTNSLNRFRLTGPLAITILTDALRILGSTSEPRGIDEPAGGESISMNSAISEPEWHTTFYQDSQNLESLLIQRESMKALATLESPNQLPPNCVMAMTVLDPRFFLPNKRTKKLAQNEFYAKISLPQTLAARSPLWKPEVRANLKNNIKSTHEINKLRSENLVPGVSDDDKFDESAISKVPIILIQHSGCCGRKRSIGFNCAIDIVIPAGWSMPFWQAFILRCARAGGLREANSMTFESLDLDSPEIHQPDIPSYDEEALTVMNNLRSKYFRYPPNRRVNFTKFAISSPFYCEWKMLMREWTNTESFYVLRDRDSLNLLKKVLLSNKIQGKRKINGSESSIEKFSNFPDANCLVPVKVSIEGKGRPRNFAIICIPTKEDLEAREARNNFSGPVQKFVIDPNERERRDVRKNHKIQFKRLRRKRYRWRKLARETANLLKLEKRSIEKPSSVQVNYTLKKEYREKMEELYLPKCEKVRYACDRETMGYVVRGDFSFCEARGIGIGYVTLDSLRNIIESQNNLVLVRNIQTRQYRFAKIEVLDRSR